MLRSSKFSRRYRRSESRKSYLSIILESSVFVGGRVRPSRQAPARVEGSSFSRINVPTEGRSQRSQNNAEGSNGGRLWDQRSENVVLFQVSQLSRATPCFPHSLDPSPPPLSPHLFTSRSKSRCLPRFSALTGRKIRDNRPFTPD